MELRQEYLPSLFPADETGYGLYKIDDYTPWLDFIHDKINKYKEDTITFYGMVLRLTYMPIKNDCLILQTGIKQDLNHNIIKSIFSCIDDLMYYLQNNISDIHVEALEYQFKLFRKKLKQLKEKNI